MSLGNGLGANKQTIAWTDDDEDRWHIFTSLDVDV